MEGRNWRSFGITKLLQSKCVACRQQPSQFGPAISHKYQLFQHGNCRCDLLRCKQVSRLAEEDVNSESRVMVVPKWLALGTICRVTPHRSSVDQQCSSLKDPSMHKGLFDVSSKVIREMRDNLSFDSNEVTSISDYSEWNRFTSSFGR